MSILEALTGPYYTGLHLWLGVACVAAAWFALRPEPIVEPEGRASYFDPEQCSCPSGDCPEWERKAGLITPDPECLIHGEDVEAA